MIDVLKLAGCSKDIFNKWLIRGNLKTKFPASRQGVQREFTHKNALELSFLTALTNSGFEVGDAQHYVDSLMQAYKSDTLPVVMIFNHRTGASRDLADFSKYSLSACAMLLPDDDGTGEIVDDDAPPDASMDDETIPAAAITCIFPRSIAARVDKAFRK